MITKNCSYGRCSHSFVSRYYTGGVYLICNYCGYIRTNEEWGVMKSDS